MQQPPNHPHEQEKGIEPEIEEMTPREETKETPKTEEREPQKPEIPQEKRPEIPASEKMPSGGPGNMQQQTAPQAATTDAKQKKEAEIKRQLSKPIPTGTPQERKASSQLEDWHSGNVLNS